MEICCHVDKMVRHPDLHARFDAAKPDPDVVEALRAIDEEVTFAIIFGFWCPDSLTIVPGVLRNIVEADNDSIQVLAASVPLDETHDLPIDLGAISVRRFPTTAILRGHYEKTDEIEPGCEIIRFVEEPLDAARLAI